MFFNGRNGPFAAVRGDALAEIAARLGYCNAAYITNIFKRHVTMLPDGNRPATPAYKIRNL